MWVFRAMVEDNGLPKLGTTATTLGIRKGKDIVVDNNDFVHRPAFLPGEANGLSCAPDPSELPPFVRPISFGGANKKTKVWAIHVDDLGTEIVAQDDAAGGGLRHVSIGPAQSMPFHEFERAIQATRSNWRIV